MFSLRQLYAIVCRVSNVGYLVRGQRSDAKCSCLSLRIKVYLTITTYLARHNSAMRMSTTVYSTGLATFVQLGPYLNIYNEHGGKWYILRAVSLGSERARAVASCSRAGSPAVVIVVIACSWKMTGRDPPMPTPVMCFCSLVITIAYTESLIDKIVACSE